MRKYPNCYYRKTITRQCDGSCGGHNNYERGCFNGPGVFKQLSTTLAADIELMNRDIKRHDPFQNPCAWMD